MKLDPDITDKRAIKRFETLESDLNEMHNGFYDYSISIYKNRHTKFKYICPKHGIQEITAGNHLKGKKCKHCAYEKAGSYHKLDENKFIKKAKKIHGSLYNYNNIKYTNIHTPIDIICKIHGSFFQSPNNHLKGHGCIECAGVNLKTTEQFINESKLIHLQTYNYDKTEYIGGKKKVTITCLIHGDFKQYPNAHLKGHGCEKCSFKLISLAKRASKEEFIGQAKKTHHLKYNYINVEYINAKSEVEIICKDHGVFNQTPDSHVRGSGCPSCAIYGFNIDLPAILYYLKIEHKNRFYYKIGITNNDVQSRFRNKALAKIVDYIEIHFEKGKEALVIEQYILKKYKNHINPNELILKDGNTEIFCSDVLGFDLLKKEKNIYLQRLV